jgi:hypothetical protein
VCALTDDMTMSSCGAVTVRRVGPEQKRVVAVAVTSLCRGAGERGCGLESQVPWGRVSGNLANPHWVSHFYL